MFEILEPLHAMLERGPQTLKETSFSQAYGRELTEAYEWSQRYKTSAVVMDLDRAWDIYYHVFQKISRQLPQLTSLELPYVSPKLMTCKDLELAVPGSYNPGQELIRISIIKTKGHPIQTDPREKRALKDHVVEAPSRRTTPSRGLAKDHSGALVGGKTA